VVSVPVGDANELKTKTVLRNMPVLFNVDLTHESDSAYDSEEELQAQTKVDEDWHPDGTDIEANAFDLEENELEDVEPEEDEEDEEDEEEEADEEEEEEEEDEEEEEKELEAICEESRLLYEREKATRENKEMQHHLQAIQQMEDEAKKEEVEQVCTSFLCPLYSYDFYL
jgi:hypothetical protein